MIPIASTPNQLNITIAYLPHPFLQERSSFLEAWGLMNLSLENKQSQEILFSTDWNIDSFMESYLEHWDNIFRDTTSDIYNDESLIQWCSRVERKEDFLSSEEEVNWETYISVFVENHNLRRSMGGARIPGFFIGINRNQGEISYMEYEAQEGTPSQIHDYYGTFKLGTWSYSFDAKKFDDMARVQIRQFLSNWRSDLERIAHDDVLDKIDRLMAMLDNLPILEMPNNPHVASPSKDAAIL